jgi:DNA repair protein RecO
VSRGLAIHRTAIVVGLQNHREADRIVRLLIPENGRISALARSARSSSKRFGGTLDIGNRLEVTLRPPRSIDGWWGLEAATLEDGRAHIRSDLERLSLLAYCTEVCSKLAREGHAEPKLFGLLDMTLSLLDAMTSAPTPCFRLGLEAKALTFAGLCPQMLRCANCEDPLQGPITLSATGAHHRACNSAGPEVSVGWLETVEQARRTPLRESIDTPMPPGPIWALAEAIESHLGTRLRSRSVLATLSA